MFLQCVYLIISLHDRDNLSLSSNPLPPSLPDPNPSILTAWHVIMSVRRQTKRDLCKPVVCTST